MIGTEQNRDYDLFDLAKAVREAAAENPDFVYKPRSYSNHKDVCVYTTPEGVADCIIGVGLAKCGDPVPAWNERTDYYASSDREIAIFGSEIWEEYFGEITLAEETVLRWLALVQSCQDRGNTWSDAVGQADRDYSDVTVRP
jgi:hypothetical protein